MEELSQAHRPSWDEYFMTLANQVATRTTCIRRGVGCVLVRDKRILATGYNGAPTGLRHCGETGCLRQQLHVPSGQNHELCRALHAEQNALIQAARYGIIVEGATLYVNTQPCVLCAGAGISVQAAACHPMCCARVLKFQREPPGCRLDAADYSGCGGWRSATKRRTMAAVRPQITRSP